MKLDIFLVKEVNDKLLTYFENLELFNELIELNKFDGKENQKIFIPLSLSKNKNRSLLVGTNGCSDSYDFVKLGAVVGDMLKEDYEIEIHNLDTESNLYSFEFGVYISEYKFDQFQNDKSERHSIKVLDSINSLEIQNKIKSIFWVRDMVNFPALTKTPEFFTDKVLDLTKNLEINVHVYEEDWLKENNFFGFLGVASGSERRPKFLVGEYNQNAKTQISLIGKGVLFDSGGLSLKSPSGMETMKTDMAGAATAWAVIVLLAKQGVDVGLKVYTPLVENMPSGSAIRPGDVLHMRNGKTIEVVNTDAEGRLIMADALAFASESKPDLICDVATLTGSAYVALGVDIGAVFSNNSEIMSKFLSANELSHEIYHSLPLEKQYKKLIKSDIADMKNSGGSFGGAITAALLLEEFVNNIDWVHLDIAGPARSRDNDPVHSKGGTGFGVLGLYNFFSKLT